MLINLVPYSNLMVHVAGIVGERLAYISSLGFVLIFGSLVWEVYHKLKFKKFVFGFIFLISTTSISYIIYRNTLWKNKLTLFDITFVPCALVWLNYRGQIIISKSQVSHSWL